MTEERFADLVGRLEGVARRSQGGYRLRVAALAALGFLYIFGVLVILLAALGAVAWGFAHGTGGRAGLRRVGWAVAALVYTILRAMWVRFERPEGLEIGRGDAPALFDQIDEIRKHMRAPRVHRVLLERELNAGVSQRPRLGVLGWQENTLSIGLPLLQALSPAQARCVLAHEFGHLSGAHSRFAGWIYRVRATWSRLLAKLEEDDHWSSFVFRPFFRWYAPYFDAYTFVLARRNEYEADDAAAALSSSRDCGDALISVNLKHAFLDHRFWRWVGEQAGVLPEPDVTPYSRMGQLLGPAPAREDAEYWLPQYLALQTTLAGTHPCLSDRLAALGVEARVPEPVAENAARAWLGDRLERYVEVFDEDWRKQQEESWHRHYAEVRGKEERLEALAQKASREALDASEMWERARLAEERRGAGEALPLYVAYAERHPDHARARFHAGRVLLGAGNEVGITHLEASMDQADDTIVPACDQIAGFLSERGDDAAATRYRDRRDAHQRKLDAIREERDTLPTDVSYLPHEAEPQAVADLVADLQAIDGVKEAWLTRRPLELSDEPLYVLAVWRRRLTWNPLTWDEWQKNPKKDDLALQSRIARAVRCPGQTKVLVLNHRGKLARQLWASLPGTRILP